MLRRAAHILFTGLALSTAVAPAAAQQQDDKVKLLSAQSAHLLEENGQSYRKVIGPARFFHNNTYLLCDTALWNVNTNIIDAIGNVRIIQDQTQLSSATLQYVVDDNMARFRGSLVQLEDKDKNTLRTRYLDYNTKDSVAIFQGGGAMRDKDGQIIESLYGTYDSKARLFVFNDQVNMYLDTTFVKTSRLEYRSDLSTAYFGYGTDMWQDDKMLSAHDGWYDRSRELFFFRRKVHVLTKDQETWADTLYYYRDIRDADLRGNVEIMDTTRNVYALAGRFEYMDSLSQVRMTREPAVMSVSDEKGVRDTLYVGADTLLMRGIPRCDVPEPWVKDAEKRLSDISGDPVMEYRRKAAEEAARAAEEAAKNDPNRPPDPPGGKGAKGGGNPPAKQQAQQAPPVENPPVEEAPPAEGPPAEEPPPVPVPPQLDSLAQRPDSLALRPQPDTLAARPQLDSLAASARPDSLKLAAQNALKAKADTLGAGAAPADTLAAARDTTKINFIWGHKRVRLFRRKMQMSADSLMYTDLDSLVRVYQDPIFFSDGNRQYASDSIYMVIKDKQVQKAHLLSNAFITIEEAPKSYDQIRGAEMVAYFDSTSALSRFDALGGASSIFYLEEKGALATVNKVDAKMIYALFKDGELDRIHYYENPKNDGYPSVQMPEEERTLKGFRWEPDKRPASPRDVTSLVPRPSERLSYLARPHTEFKQTEDYFPGHIRKIYREIAIRDSLQVARERERRRVEDSLARAEADTLALADSLLAPPDSLRGALDSLRGPLDSLQAPLDSLRSLPDSLSTAPADSLATPAPQLSEKEIKAREKAERDAQKERERQERQAAREAKWAEEDRIYEEKQAAKAQRKLDKERAKKLKLLRKLEKKAQRERLIFERYLERERKKELKQKDLTE